MTVRQWLHQAFAVDPPGPAEPTAEQRVIIDRMCAQVIRRHLTTPAILALEMSRPLNYLGAQAMHFFQPIIAVVTDARGYELMAKYLEQRGSIEYLCRRLEEMEAERAPKAKTQADAGAERRTADL